MTGYKTAAKRKGIWKSAFFHVSFFAVPLFIMSISYANPVLNSVVAGGITVQQSGNTVQINQSTERGIISWDSFNISAGEKTRFNQPNASAITLNRINPQQGPSQIFGQLSSNGRIILINGAGLYFGSGAMVNVGGIIASTSDISNANFFSGKYIFDKPSTYHGAIVNKGTITAGDYGVVVLLGAVVENDGLIRAHLGSIALGSGSQFTLDFSGDQLITFAVTAPVSHGGVTNTGKLLANGGQILVTAAAAQGVLDNVINMSGYAEARSSSKQHDGSIVLSASNGNVVVSGKLSVAGTRHHGSAGNISISGNNIVLTKAAVINANAGKTGAGGNVTIKAINSMQDYGKITAQGGVLSGNGGSVETSGANIDVSGAKINLTAAHGQTGTWLLDPSDLTISNSVTSNLNASGNANTANQTSSSQVPNLNVADLENALSTANIVVQTSSTGTGGSGDITVMNNIAWSSSNSLTLSAYRDISINAGVTIANTNDATLILRADNTGTGIGTVNFNPTANINFSAGGAVNIYYNPSSYTAPKDYTSLVTGVTPTAYMLVNSAANLAEVSTNLNGNYALGNNITLSGDFSPIGNSKTPYTAKFDGQGFSISGLTIVDATAGANIGLFGATSGATISNVHLQNVNITENANANTVAALTGYAVNTTFKNDSMSGSVTVTINNTNNSSYIGGLVGFLEAGSWLTDSYSSGAINVVLIANNGGNLYVGGLAGAVASNGSVSQNSAINNDYSSSFIKVSGQNNGGVVDVGGLVGANGYDSFTDAGGNISNSYSTGYVNTTLATTNNGTTNTGGFLGFEDSAASSALLTSNFWDTGTSGFDENHGVGNISGTVSGLTAGCFSGDCGTSGGTANLSAASTYSTSGWDLSGVWNIIDGHSYPYLAMSYPTTPEIISGTSAASGNTQVNLVSNGVVIDSIPTGANGFFYSLQAPGTIAGNTAVLAYIPGMSGNDVFVVPASGSGGLSGLAITANTLTAGGNFTSAMSNSSFASAVGSLTDPSILYSASGSNLTVGTVSHPDTDFVATSGTTYTLNGNLTTTGSQTYVGPVSITEPTTISGTGFSFSGVISGGDNLTIVGSSLTGTNTLSYANYYSGVDVGLSNDVNSGTVSDITSGKSIGEFSNINNIVGNQRSVLQLPTNANLLTFDSGSSGTVGDPIKFSQFSDFVNTNNNTNVLFDTSVLVNSSNGQVTIDGVPVDLVGFDSQNFSGDVVMAPSDPLSSKQEDQQQLNMITSYTNYVNNIPPSSGPPTPVYVNDHVVIKEVASSCSSVASADAENNITLSESCAP